MAMWRRGVAYRLQVKIACAGAAQARRCALPVRPTQLLALENNISRTQVNHHH